MLFTQYFVYKLCMNMDCKNNVFYRKKYMYIIYIVIFVIICICNKVVVFEKSCLSIYSSKYLPPLLLCLTL